jgi:uncharacterized membrane protein
VVWIGLNLVEFAWHWDAYPFILLNLLFSTQAAYAAPVILLSQNRQADTDAHGALPLYRAERNRCRADTQRSRARPHPTTQTQRCPHPRLRNS